MERCLSIGGTDGNGKKIKIDLYDEAATGGGGALLKNFGEITLDGTQTIPQLASSWASTLLGWHFLRIVSDAAPVVFGMGSVGAHSSVGLFNGVPGTEVHGTFVGEVTW